MLAAAGPPPPITRDGARAAARHELSKPIYHRQDEPIALRVLRWIGEHVQHLLSRAADATPGGGFGLVAFVLLAVAIFIVIRVRTGPMRRAARVPGLVFEVRETTAAAHRAAAEQFARDQDWDDAVRERFRATVRELEERTVLDPRPGRTAREAALDTGHVLPDLRTDMLRAASLFDEVRYAGRGATADSYRIVADVDDRVRAARLPALV